MTRLVLGLAVFWVVAAAQAAEPWGIARGGSGGDAALSRTDAFGAAVLEDADLAADVTDVVFTRSVRVASVSLAGRTLVFSSEGGATLTCVPRAESSFELDDGDWTFRNLELAGGEVGLDVPQFGGAIGVTGGSLTLEGCSFTGFIAQQTGGAVSASLMDGDVTVTNCVFAGNFAGPFNGGGGAIYASAAGDATLRILDCVFEGNEADNGGALFTLSKSIFDDEKPIRVEIGGGTVFSENLATYSGGALLAEGNVLITGPGTRFAGNLAGSDGGAVCLTGVDGSATLSSIVVSNGVWFTDNATSHLNTWTSGGAVAVTAAAASRFERVGFTGNAARTESGAWSYGGAVSCTGGSAAFDTCVFDCADAGSDACCGNAVDLNGTAAALKNCTFRRGVLEAVSISGAAVSVTNCVLVGNGLAGGSVGDLYLVDGAAVSLAYSAYGAVEKEEGTSFAEEKCLAGRTTDIYRGETLYLDGTVAYNPVAAEGLVQDACDFDGVPYGSKPEGWSMGAYECGTVKDDPKIRLDAAVWYHNRTDGLYYPRLDLTFVRGDAARIAGVMIVVDGSAQALPESCVAQLRTAADGEAFSFGVGEGFVQFPNGAARSGFVPPEDRILTGVYDPARPPELSVTVSATLVVRPRTSFTAAARTSRPLAAKAAESLRSAESFRFAEFSVAEGQISGCVTGGNGGSPVLYGCASLGDGWTRICALNPNASGRFEVEVSREFRFFRLDEETAR